MTKTRLILLVGGDSLERASLARALEAGGAYSLTVVASGLDAMARTHLRGERFDAIIADADLPDCDVTELCARIRRRGLRIPIIVVSDVPSEADIVHALDAGANDYMARPFRIGELTARLRAQIREHDTSEDAVLLVGPYHFRPGSRLLHEPVGNVQIRLTQKEVTILKCLYRAAGRPVSRQTLLQ
jgi:DNA-binding response OmpR family regulator